MNLRSTRTTLVRMVALLAAATLALVACGGGNDTVERVTGGWLGDAPDFDGVTGREAVVGHDAPDALESAPMSDEVSAGASASRETSLVADDGTPLQAGNVDDNADFARFLDYLERIASLGVETRDYDPTGRIVVTVTGPTGAPAAGVEVVVEDDGAEVARVRTTADGTARFHPAVYSADPADSYDFTADAVTGSAEPGDAVTLELSSEAGATSPVPLDVLFLLDATGSMGDEIDRLKTNIDAIAAQVDALSAAPDVRFAMTLYRDEGDDFVTATYDFTSDVAEFQAALADVVAAGGGDYPEALDEGLAEALGDPAWRDPADAVQLIFLVADAPPQITRDVPVPYTDSIRDAIARGVKIFPVATSGADDQAEAVFRQLAQATGARFVFLSYGAGGAATGTETDIDRTDYEELALDALIVRLISEELAALTGGDVAPPPTTTPTTIPPGQN